ncbi:unnamed protein product, partial [Prorocentrum cordatum]
VPRRPQRASARPRLVAPRLRRAGAGARVGAAIVARGLLPRLAHGPGHAARAGT